MARAERSFTMRSFRLRWLCLIVAGWLLAPALCATTARADEINHRLDIYFIDVEGGAATLLVTPRSEEHTSELQSPCNRMPSSA